MNRVLRLTAVFFMIVAVLPFHSLSAYGKNIHGEKGVKSQNIETGAMDESNIHYRLDTKTWVKVLKN